MRRLAGFQLAVALFAGALPVSAVQAATFQATSATQASAVMAGCGEPQSDVAASGGITSSGGVEVEVTETTSGGKSCDNDPYEYRRLPDICGANSVIHYCAAVSCASPDEVGYFVEKRLEGSNAPWQRSGIACIGPDGPVVTPDQVLEAVRRMGLPEAELQTEPGFDSGKTLVNFDTNFYTKVAPVTETFTLLGQQVTVAASPSSYTWHFDSGLPDEIRTTSMPGAPYPNLQVTYAYEDAHTKVHPSVDVTYQARFSVNGGTWQAIAETVTIEGEPISRYVAEATAMLAEMN